MSTGQEMDAIDRKIVALLQDDASLSLAQIAHRVGLSQSPCWKRIQRLEKSGVIIKREHACAAQLLREHQHTLTARDTDSNSLVFVFPIIKAYDAFYKRLIDTM